MLGLGYEGGKRAEDSANNVRMRLKDLDVLGAIKRTLDKVDQNSGACRHYMSTMKTFTEGFVAAGMDADEAEIAALASYMFGGATTDGACLGLMEQLSGNDNKIAESLNLDKAITHWCTAHVLSLIARYIFAQKEKKSIKPTSSLTRKVLKDLNTVVSDLVAAFDKPIAFEQVKRAAAKCNYRPPHTLKPLTETRFNSFADLLADIYFNVPIYLEMKENEIETCPEAVEALFAERVVEDAGIEVTYVPYREMKRLLPIATNLARLITMAEGEDQDPFLLEAELSRFVRQISGAQVLKFETNTADKGKVLQEWDRAKLTTGSVVMHHVIDSLQNAIGHYIDGKLHEDWSLLLCLILHPGSAGQPANGDNCWPCFNGRFSNIWRHTVSDDWQRVDSRTQRNAVMKAAEKVLREELELQYEIDNAACDCDADSETSATAAELPPTKRAHILIPDDDLFGPVDTPTTDSVVASSNEEAVKKEMEYWFNRAPSKETKITLVQFWKQQPDSMLRRVAMRAAPYMTSQCATERVNKMPKDLWSESRMSLRAASVFRDVFLYANMSWLPEIQFKW